MVKYTDEEKKEHTKEIQNYLWGISQVNHTIPAVIPDGIYGKETAEAVRIFQMEYGLPPTGEVDSRTWDELVYEYETLTKKFTRPELISAFPRGKDYVIIRGDKGYIVYLIQAMLDALSVVFDNMPKLNINGEYEENTENSVKSFQNKSGLNTSGNVDRNTWDELVRTVNSAERGGLILRQTEANRKNN